MNFFERQDAAKGTTLKLVLLFATAVIALVAVIDGVVALAMSSRQSDAGSIVATLVVVTAVTLLIIAGGMISKTVALRRCFFCICPRSAKFNAIRVENGWRNDDDATPVTTP